MTIKDIAQKLGVSTAAANGLASFLREKGMLVKAGERPRKEGINGRAAIEWTLTDTAQADVGSCIETLRAE